MLPDLKNHSKSVKRFRLKNGKSWCLANEHFFFFVLFCFLYTVLYHSAGARPLDGGGYHSGGRPPALSGYRYNYRSGYRYKYIYDGAVCRRSSHSRFPRRLTRHRFPSFRSKIFFLSKSIFVIVKMIRRKFPKFSYI